MPDRLRIAVIGGGPAGTFLAIALHGIPHVEVQLFESSPDFSQRGLGIGLSKFGLQALDGIIPSAREFLKNEAGAVETKASRVVIGSGEQAGTVVLDIAADEGLGMDRPSLLRALLPLLPEQSLRGGMRLVSLSQSPSGVSVVFEDGTVHRFDAVIGADGIFSSVRQHVLEDAHLYAASPAGWWECRNLVPLAKAREALGEKSFEIDREYGWAGDGAFMMHALVENRTKVQCIMSMVEKESPITSDRKSRVTREALEEAFTNGWLQDSSVRGMVRLMLDQEDPNGYSLWEHKFTPRYSNGRVCIIGDAAHTVSPFQGAGAGLAIEDVVIINHLLHNITSPKDIDAAFRAFDTVRRPRCQEVTETSRATGHLLCGQMPDVGVDATKMRDALGPLFVPLDNLDLEQHKQAALAEFQRESMK